MDKIFESCGIPTNIHELKDRVDDGSLKRALCGVFKVDTDIENLDYMIRLNRQRLYVELDPTIFPKDVVDAFDKRFNEINESRTTYFVNTDVVGMSKGTRFEKAHVASERGAKLNSIFKNLIDRPVITIKI
jgi:hypothetical protein